MININLLPPDARRSHVLRQISWPMIPVLHIIAAMLVLVLSVHLPLWAMTSWRSGALSKLERQRTTEGGIETDPASLRAQLQNMADRIAELDTLLVQPSVWAKQLNALADLMPDGFWLDEVNLDPMRKLTIRGHAMTSKGSETAEVGRWMRRLRQHEAFFSPFTQVSLDHIEREVLGNFAAVQFSISCAVIGAQDDDDAPTQP